MCGSSDSQNQINTAQINFMNQLSSQYATTYGQNQQIFNQLQASLAPLVAGGPSQEGYSPEQKAALNAQATEGAAQAYRQTATATREQQMARGGGNIPFTNAADEQLNGQIAISAENNLNNQKLDILNNDYATGRANYATAVGALSGVPGAIENPLTSSAGAVTGSGNAAASEANTIQAANDSWMGLVGGLADTALSGGLKLAGGGKKAGG